jgi:hypothetical protein
MRGALIDSRRRKSFHRMAADGSCLAVNRGMKKAANSRPLRRVMNA